MTGNPTMGSLLVITGPPGAGKSTVAKLLIPRFEQSVLIEGDAFFAFFKTGAIEPWLPESHGQNTVVTQAAASAAGRFASGGFMTIYDGVVGPWFLPVFSQATTLSQLDYVVLLPSVEECVRRVASRADHGFDNEDATRHMHDQFANAEIAPRHVFADSPYDSLSRAEAILAAMASGQLTHSVVPS
jgi:predicted ABC-type ATPase